MTKWLSFLLLAPSLTWAVPKAEAPGKPALRPFVGAHLVWTLRGPPALGPESGQAIEDALTHPVELTPDCQVGDLSLRADGVEIQLKCLSAVYKVAAHVRAGSSPLGVETQAKRDLVLATAEKALQRRLDALGSALPLQHPLAAVGADAPQPPGALGHWQRATAAMRLGDLSAAITATDLALAEGPSTLSPVNRLDAAIAVTALGRFARVKSWLGDTKKLAPEDPEGMAVRALLGRQKEVLALADTCVAPEGRPACDIGPLLRVLIAQHAWQAAGHLLEIRINHHEPAPDDVRLALGVADLGHDASGMLKWSVMLTKLRPTDSVGWQTAARVSQTRAHLSEVLLALLQAPEEVAKQADTLELVVRLLDAQLDPLSPDVLDAKTLQPLAAAISACPTTAGRFAQAVLNGWQGDIKAADQLAALPEADSDPLLLAQRALALLATGHQSQAEPLIVKASARAPTNPHVAEAQWQLAVAQGKPEAEALAAYERLETASAVPDAAFRTRRADAAAALRAWGLTPPQRWPVPARPTP